MKLTKGMKKALSLLLSAAMVVTGVNVTTNTASAEETNETTVTKYVYDFTAAADDNGEIKATINDSAEGIFSKEDGGSRSFIPLAVSDEIAKMEKPVYKVTALSEGATLTLWDFNWDNRIVADDKEIAINGATVTASEFKGTYKDADDKDVDYTQAFEVGKTELPLKLKATGKGPEWNDKEGRSFLGFMLPHGAHATIEIYDAAKQNKIDDSYDDGYTAYMVFQDGSGANWQNWTSPADGGVGTTAKITGNGTYTVSLSKEDVNAEEAFSEVNVLCVDIIGLAKAQHLDASDIAVSDVTVTCDGRKLATDGSKMYAGDIEKKGTFRMEIANKWGYGAYQGGEYDTCEEFAALNENFTCANKIAVTFTISGLKEGVTPSDAFLTKDGEDTKVVLREIQGKIDADPVPSPSADVNPSPSAGATASPAGGATTTPGNTKTTSGPSITTKPAVSATPQAVGTSKITPKKKLVVVAPGKSVKVAFTTKAAAPATKAAVVTASTSAKKVVTAKVSGKKVTIKAPKKAVKGSSATVTLKSTNGDKKVSAKIKVYVRNSAKKVKAAKKSITVKKNKTTKLVIKASKVQNKKKAFADTITVKGKILKLTNVKYAKGKATLTLKGAKKAKKKAVTIKVGKKSVKIKATVK